MNGLLASMACVFYVAYNANLNKYVKVFLFNSKHLFFKPVFNQKVKHP